MPRNARCVLPGTGYHITQRGSDRRSTFFTQQDRVVYMDLLRANLADCGVRLLAYCLMTNHVHLVAIPEAGDALGVLFRRVHGRYAQYLNARRGRSGHLWQNRYFSCPLASDSHLWTALRYVERNPVRAGIASQAEDYRWSSALAHLTGVDGEGILDLAFWRESGGALAWRELLGQVEEPGPVRLLRRCTYAGRPFGDEGFLTQWEEQFQRKWRRWAFEQGSTVSEGAATILGAAGQ